MKNKIAPLIAASAIFGALVAGGTAFAQTTPAPSTTHQGYASGRGMGMRGAPGMKPGVVGKVTAVSGITLTVASQAWGGMHATSSAASTPSTYTVDASNATVFKNNATSTLSAVAVGDTVMVQGTVSGSSVAATQIRDGLPQMPGGGKPMTKPVVAPGNGEPVIGGSVTALNGSTLTVGNKAGVTYTVDASSAFVVKSNATSSVSSIAVGDNVVVQGAVNGNSVTASSVTDAGTPPTGNANAPGGPKGGFGGVMSAIGGFFQQLFGFF